MKNVVKINIKKKEDYGNKFNDDSLSKDISNYILEECKSFNIKEDFNIVISSNYDMDDLEKDKIVDMIRAYFGVEISELTNKRRKTIYMDIITFLLAVLALIVYLIISDVPILSEFILVFSWVLIWESTYNLIFGSITNKMDIIRRKKITSCKILFK